MKVCYLNSSYLRPYMLDLSIEELMNMPLQRNYNLQPKTDNPQLTTIKLTS